MRPSKLEAWAKPTWWFTYAAVLPIVIAAVTLAALYLYRKDGTGGAKLEAALFDTLDLHPGMSVGQFEPSGPYLLSQLRARVGASGNVYSLRAKDGANPRELLDVVFLPALGGRERLEPALESATRYLKPSGKLALTGPPSLALRTGSAEARRAEGDPPRSGNGWLALEDAKSLALRTGFRLTGEAALEAPVYVLVFELGKVPPRVDPK